MIFALMAFGFMLLGRKLGWFLCKNIFYPSSKSTVIILSIFGGVLIAISIRLLLDWQQPGAVLRWVMGYALGTYVAIPNYGLLDAATVPDDVMPKHKIISNVPPVIYIATSVVFAFLFPYG